ncbi:MAG: type III-B CRISPR module RAMP protein Cmr4 [Marinospirillum sp.]|nr:type III-B CRISPR module RAMP protein Cmr4 [Marinospirillum sp.]
MAHQILGLTCETPLHAGGGSKEDVIDLPIQKEAHSNWPCVYGSSMKGALRARAETNAAMEPTLIQQAFGPDTSNASEHAGALLVSDARLLLLPVRSLTSHFKLVTCPALLQRLLTDLARSQAQVPEPPKLPQLSATQAASPQPENRTAIYLEEFKLGLTTWENSAAWIDLIFPLIAAIPGVPREDQRQALQEQLLLVDNDSFKHLCISALPVLPHIAIDSATKIVKNGALWYEENLPQDTLLYTVIGCQPSRKEKHECAAAELLQRTLGGLFQQPYVQIGGNETTGMGWCRVAQPQWNQGGQG